MYGLDLWYGIDKGGTICPSHWQKWEHKNIYMKDGCKPLPIIHLHKYAKPFLQDYNF